MNYGSRPPFPAYFNGIEDHNEIQVMSAAIEARLECHSRFSLAEMLILWLLLPIGRGLCVCRGNMTEWRRPHNQETCQLSARLKARQT